MKFLFLSFFVSMISAQATESMPTKFVICKLREEVRTLEIQPGGPEQGCETLYSKYNREPERVGWGKNFAGCELVLENVKRNLEGNDWKCEDKTSNRVVAQ